MRGGGPQARRRSRRNGRSPFARRRRAACGPYPGCCRGWKRGRGLLHRGKDVMLDISHHAVIENGIIKKGEQPAYRAAKLRLDAPYS